MLLLLLLPFRRNRFLLLAAAEDDDDDDNDDHGFELRNTLLMWSRMNPCLILCSIIFDEEDRLAAAAAAVSMLPFLTASWCYIKPRCIVLLLLRLLLLLPIVTILR